LTKILNGIALPKVLYKYRDWENSFHKKLITHQQIYLAEPYSFNDPFDCKIPTRWEAMTQKEMDVRNQELIATLGVNLKRMQKKQFEKNLKKQGLWWDKKNIKKPGKDYFDKINKISGVISLTSKADNILMWSHYSNNHHGICVGFNTEILQSLEVFDFIGKVSYTKEYPFISGAFEIDQRFYLEMFSKSADWEYEDEYRITKRHMENRTATLPKEAIDRVIIGCEASVKVQDKVIQKVKKHLPTTKLFKAHRKEFSFGIEFEEIEQKPC